MKRQFINLVSIIMLVVYTVFSTGLAFSVHHCCNHCFSHEKVARCGCNDSDSQKNANFGCSDNQNDMHHRNHDRHLFFKLTDKYKKADGILIPVSHIAVEPILLFCCENCKSFTINQIIKIRKNSPPLLLQKGTVFLESVHQLKLCC